MQEDTAVRVGIPIRPTPFHVQFIVAVFLLGVHIAERLAGDEDLTVAYGIDLIGGDGVFVDYEIPVRQVFPVEQFLGLLCVRPIGETEEGGGL